MAIAWDCLSSWGSRSETSLARMAAPSISRSVRYSWTNSTSLGSFCRGCTGTLGLSFDWGNFVRVILIMVVILFPYLGRTRLISGRFVSVFRISLDSDLFFVVKRKGKSRGFRMGLGPA